MVTGAGGQIGYSLLFRLPATPLWGETGKNWELSWVRLGSCPHAGIPPRQSRRTRPGDTGLHTDRARMTKEFLEFSQRRRSQILLLARQ
jgi:hypothetical protein